MYFLRVVIHDWSDAESKKILSNLRTAAGTASKLVIFDSLAVPTCEDPSSSVQGPKAPAPLLANLGIAGQGFLTALDIQVCD